MSERIGGAAKAEGVGPEAGGMPVAAAPAAKKFFLLEYFDEVRRGISWMRTAPKPEQNIVQKVKGGLTNWSKLRKARVGMVVVLLVVGAAYGLFSAQAGSTPIVPFHGQAGPGPTGNEANGTFSGRVTEMGNTSGNTSDLPTRLASLKVVLSWRDETVGGGLQNQPDQLGLAVRAPNGLNWTVAPTQTSPVPWNLPDPAKDYGAGPWAITVLGGTMGDVTHVGGGTTFCLPSRCTMDTGNDFSVAYNATW
jgi:hypothetical protein